MKIKYITEVKKTKPMTAYKARCLFDIEQVLGNKKTHYTKLKCGEYLAYYSKP